MPNLSNCIDQLKSNEEAWKNYKETEEDKKLYAKREDSTEAHEPLASEAVE